jgi:cytochrome c peroxidase
MNLSTGQKAALVAFLKTLTDTSVTSDEKFSDPFRYQAE